MKQNINNLEKIKELSEVQKSKLENYRKTKTKLEERKIYEKYSSFSLDLSQNITINKLRKYGVVIDKESTKSAKEYRVELEKTTKKIPLLECFNGEKCIQYTKRLEYLQNRKAQEQEIITSIDSI